VRVDVDEFEMPLGEVDQRPVDPWARRERDREHGRQRAVAQGGVPDVVEGVDAAAIARALEQRAPGAPRPRGGVCAAR
jgi:hypothetical protein